MNESNQQTLQSYEDNIKDYIAGTPSEVDGHIKQWIDASLRQIPKNGFILELGSGSGRDADYIESLGYVIDRTDAAKGFVEIMQQKGASARLLNIVTDNLPGPYDMVFANAVLLHLREDEFSNVLQKIYEALRSKGILSFSVQYGEGEAWKGNRGGLRFFQYWSEDAIRDELKHVGFVESEISSDPAGKWMHVITKKIT